MTEKKEDLDKKFRDWKKDLDRRCEEYLKKHPERKGQPTLPAIPANTSPLFPERVRVQVFESIVKPGSWLVYRNNEKVMTFFGANAHQNATKFAGDLLQE
jgi:hypothetical protein